MFNFDNVKTVRLECDTCDSGLITLSGVNYFLNRLMGLPMSECVTLNTRLNQLKEQGLYDELIVISPEFDDDDECKFCVKYDNEVLAKLLMAFVDGLSQDKADDLAFNIWLHYLPYEFEAESIRMDCGQEGFIMEYWGDNVTKYVTTILKDCKCFCDVIGINPLCDAFLDELCHEYNLLEKIEEHDFFFDLVEDEAEPDFLLEDWYNARYYGFFEERLDNVIHGRDSEFAETLRDIINDIISLDDIKAYFNNLSTSLLLSGGRIVDGRIKYF